MKRGAGQEAICEELDPAVMRVLDYGGAEYPGEYWTSGAKIKVGHCIY